MRELLREFYFGNIMPCEKQMVAGSELFRATHKAAQFEHQLMDQLTENEKAILNGLVDAQHKIDSLTAMENFIYGFRLGVRLMAECMDESDGNLREVGE